ncbi:TadA family conjugal transfer-associated ATPase [Microbacterium sp. SSW1-59]|uniref:TadA family conjugal transfer-associated ATPase n=1 Tax=Microbacterium xanthum TaxID=3079794 RepID=UPI002AD47F80|nr:TadA family conjugal transfer-associated ATPase [Microbacterium sp. SSW1-59]MDZ8200012.1 TadA family conjugal transfer-associated ATPase [Microbacterium sp. SSW1-59]
MAAPFVVTRRDSPAPADSSSPVRSADQRAPAAPDQVVAVPAVMRPFERVLRDRAVTDLFLSASRGLHVDRGDGAHPEPGWSLAEDEVRDLATALIGAGDRHIDDAHPCVDVRLADGIRVHAVLPPVASAGTEISIRIPRVSRPGLDELERSGMFGAEGRARLTEVVAERRNVLVTGAAGAGKTTLLAALLSAASPLERIVTVEDVAELRVDHPHHVRLEARQANLEGAGAVDLSRLVREALRMRPDRLAVGEVRGAELRDLLGALNTGHDGGAGTVHANGIEEVAARLEALGALAGWDDRTLARQTVSALHVVIHVARRADGRRVVASIGSPRLDGSGRLRIEGPSWPS